MAVTSAVVTTAFLWKEGEDDGRLAAGGSAFCFNLMHGVDVGGCGFLLERRFSSVKPE